MPLRSPVELRQTRLRNDYATMENIRRPCLSWKSIAGEAPFVEQYEITLRLRTIIGPTPDYRDDHIIRVTLGPDYPINAPPSVQMLTRPLPFHPNWWPSGKWDCGRWLIYETLGAHVIRMVQSLQYIRDHTYEHCPSNHEASRWYVTNRAEDWFPCDRTILPSTEALTYQRVKRFRNRSKS
jgi:ubiquitin-protein ligase